MVVTFKVPVALDPQLTPQVTPQVTPPSYPASYPPSACGPVGGPGATSMPLNVGNYFRMPTSRARPSESRTGSGN